MEGDAVDLFKFPAPRFHDGDGGRYIGTGDCLINAEPESGFINAGTYRMQLHDHNLLGLWMSPGQHGRMICAKYWEQGKSCPVVVTFSHGSVTIYARAYQSCLGQFGARLCRRPHGAAFTIYSRSADRSADSRRGGDRHRGRGAAAKASSRAPRGRSVNGRGITPAARSARAKRSRSSKSKRSITATIRSWRKKRRFGRER